MIRKAVWLGKGPAPAESPGQHVEEMPTASAPEIPPLAAASPAMLATDAVNLAAAPAATAEAHPLTDDVVVSYGERRYRGLSKNLSPETLKVNLHIGCGEAYYIDTFDLYSARARNLYLVNAAKDLGVR